MTSACLSDLEIVPLGGAGALSQARHGDRAVRLATMIELGLPVPTGQVLPVELVSRLATEPDLAGKVAAALCATTNGPVLHAVRGSAPDRSWGGVRAILNIGISDTSLDALAEQYGRRTALDLYRRLAQSFGSSVCGLDPEVIESVLYDHLRLRDVEDETDLDEDGLRGLIDGLLAAVLDDSGAPFPQDPKAQLEAALLAAARHWERPTARMLRQAKGAPEDAGLALIVQDMAIGLGQGASGAGRIDFVDEKSGTPRITGRYLANAQGDDAGMGMRTPQLVSAEDRIERGLRGISLQEAQPDVFAGLVDAGGIAEAGFHDRVGLEFTVEVGQIFLLDAWSSRRSARAALHIAVELAERGAITREQAVLQVDPGSLNEHLHPQIDPDAPRDRIGRGLAASPGAASGELVFSAEAALVRHAQGTAVILVRVETSPEDIRGMYSARGVLTVRGGMTSHAAVIARGLGLPCVVGASDLVLNLSERVMRAADGRVFKEGDMITVDGSIGEALAGAAPTIPAVVTGAFATLVGWADGIRRMKVRANADTPQDARVAREFSAEGIGLCRTEQMFFAEDRISVMQEMILAGTHEARQAALNQLLPMQRGDFEELFDVMSGRPVTIRLLDPPLHEFLPHGDDEIAALAERMQLPVEKVRERVEELVEFNPMLGMRGVRLAVTMPEIYEMQARAIFEAAHKVNARAPDEASRITPEIMIPFVSAQREVELVRQRIEAIADEVRKTTGTACAFHLGVMVETPRAALRAGDLARSSTFLSFGTNDLTQMTYGLSRDDAGRFMRDYVNTGVFSEDPFHSLDVVGVGELLMLATSRARETDANLSLSVCGEHAGDPASIHFCELAGFDYISCSPFRTPIARLAAAQAALLRRPK